MNNAVIAVLAIALGLGAWASTTDSDEPETATATADSGQPGTSTRTADPGLAPTATADPDQPVGSPVRITRVNYDPPGPDADSNADLNHEWVAIKNFGQRTRQLEDWTLHDTSGHVFRFPQLRLRSSTTVMVHTGAGRRTRHDLYWARENDVWSNTGDRATLRNSDGRLIDRCSWSDGNGLKRC